MNYEISESMLDEKNILIMKLLHYFITERNYNPVILQGVDNEIWLENLEEDYKIVRIVSASIINDEQYGFDIFKTKRIVKKIKKKTLSFKIDTLSIFLDLQSDANLTPSKDITCLRIKDENDIIRNETLKNNFPDMDKKLEFSEDGMQLFIKITNDINKHNIKDSKKVEEVFKPKYPMITYIIIFLNIALYLFPNIFNSYNTILNNYCIHGPSIRMGEYYRILTGTFLHGNFLHLLFNIYAIYIIGKQLESFIGKWKFLLVYLFSAITGSLMSMIFLNNGASVGASGAVFGLMGSLVYFGYHYRVYLGNVVTTQIIPLIAGNLMLGFLVSGIDNFAHVGGLIGGFIITIALGVKYKSKPSEKINGYILSIIYTAFLIYMAFIYSI